MKVSGQLHAPAPLPPGGGDSSTHWIGGWVRPSGSCGEEKNLLSYLESNAGRPPFSPSLCRLSYPGSSPSGHLYIFTRLLWQEKKLLAKFPKQQWVGLQKILEKMEENENAYFNLSFRKKKIKIYIITKLLDVKHSRMSDVISNQGQEPHRTYLID
jgi:hypothetical protein